MNASLNLQGGLPALLTIHDIATLFRVRRTAAYARTRDPDFPDPLVISGSCYRWYSSEVLAYIESRRSPKKRYPVDTVAAPLHGDSAGPGSADLPKARSSRRPRSDGPSGPSGA